MKPAKELEGLIADINPTEISAQIANDNLGTWCKIITNCIWVQIVNLAEDVVVRCKDCKHAEESEEHEWLLCHYYGNQWNEKNHYCSHGERG